MATPLRLRVFKAGSQVDCKDFDCSIIKIGRLSAAQLCLDDDKVSRIHAVIDVAVDGTFSIIDMGSVEGTFVNGKRINRGDLRFGDEIRVGNTSIHVEDASVAERSVTEQALPAFSPALSPPSSAPSLSAPPLSPPSSAAAAGVSLPAAVPPTVPVAVPIAVPTSAVLGSPPSASAMASSPALAASPSVASVSPKGVERRGFSAAVKPVEHVPRRGSSSGGRPLGLAIRMLWGDQPLESHYFSPSQKAHFVVGSGSGVDFPMGDLLFRGDRLEVVSFDKGQASLQFTEKMQGEFHANGKPPMQLSAAIQSKVATLGDKDQAYSIDLHDSDFVWINLGDDIVLEAHMDTEPKPAWIPFLNRVDFAALNIFLVIALLSSLFLISAVNMDGGRGLVDELSGNDARLVKLIEQSPEIQQNIQRKIENIKKANTGEAAARAQGDEGQLGKKDAPQREGNSTPRGDPNDSNRQREVLARMFNSGGGVAGSVVVGPGRGGQARAALSGLQGTTYGDAAGTHGMGMRGIGWGGGGTSLSSIGIGGADTKGGSSFGDKGTPGLIGRSKADLPEISSSTPIIDGNIDGELIRQRIRANISKIRACYEDQLIRYPQLAGRVSVRFVINGDGTVDSSRVHQSAMSPRNAEIGECIAKRIRTLEFPRPKGGGTAHVTYPFVFKPAGQ
ncbi:MAG: AgmX/PglI C-terminal domain-containing protein [Cystobacterineae bacterium]|nr:AgmX/PglI C-terminal domain-containing protein [Cystobacterineae bacterium]